MQNTFLLIAQFCTELAGKKKEPNYKKMLEELEPVEINQTENKQKGGER